MSISRAVARRKDASLKASKRVESCAKGNEFFPGFQKCRYALFPVTFEMVMGAMRWCFSVLSGVHQYSVAKLQGSTKRLSSTYIKSIRTATTSWQEDLASALLSGLSSRFFHKQCKRGMYSGLTPSKKSWPRQPRGNWGRRHQGFSPTYVRS